MTVSRSLMFFILFYVFKLLIGGASGLWLLGTQLFFGFWRLASGDPIRFLASGVLLLGSQFAFWLPASGFQLPAAGVHGVKTRW